VETQTAGTAVSCDRIYTTFYEISLISFTGIYMKRWNYTRRITPILI